MQTLVPMKSEPKRAIPKQSGTLRRAGVSTILVLTVMLLVGLFVQQSVRSMWLLRRGQDQSQRIAQTRELLELARILERQARRNSAQQLIQLQEQPIIVAVGSHFGRLDWKSPDDRTDQQAPHHRSHGHWVAQMPVDAAGAELPGLPITLVSSEESEL